MQDDPRVIAAVKEVLAATTFLKGWGGCELVSILTSGVEGFCWRFRLSLDSATSREGDRNMVSVWGVSGFV